MTATDAFTRAFFALPLGTFTGRAHDRRYVVSRQVTAGNRSHKLVAHELGGTDYISLNLYQTRNSGALLRPCEMPTQKVVAFVLALTPEGRPNHISEQHLCASAQSQLIALNVNIRLPT